MCFTSDLTGAVIKTITQNQTPTYSVYQILQGNSLLMVCDSIIRLLNKV